MQLVANSQKTNDVICQLRLSEEGGTNNSEFFNKFEK